MISSKTHHLPTHRLYDPLCEECFNVSDLYQMWSNIFYPIKTYSEHFAQIEKATIEQESDDVKLRIEATIEDMIEHFFERN